MYVNELFKLVSALLHLNKIWSYILHFQFVVYLATLYRGEDIRDIFDMSVTFDNLI